MITVWLIAGGMLVAAAALTMFRFLAGPNTMDRLVALDTLVMVGMCGLATWAAYSQDSTVVYGLTALSLITFIGSIGIARFRVPDVDAPGDNL